jgi:hypothetical protein
MLLKSIPFSRVSGKENLRGVCSGLQVFIVWMTIKYYRPCDPDQFLEVGSNFQLKSEQRTNELPVEAHSKDGKAFASDLTSTSAASVKSILGVTTP